MKIAIMQPYLFPYLGYFSLIKNTDYFVFFDTPQYIRKGWINRNRILKENGEPTYFTVPIQKTERETAILNIKIDNQQDWKKKILGQLSYYKRRAPYYEETMEVVQNVLGSEDAKLYISRLGIKSCLEVCKYLEINVKYDVFSKMDLEIGHVGAPDEWALEITKAMGYDTYVNPPGGMEFFDSAKYEKEGIQLRFLQNNLPQYTQRIGKFVSGLSILDVMMFNSVDDIRKMLNDCTVKGENVDNGEHN